MVKTNDLIEENKTILENINTLAKNDKQINTSGIFSKLTDFQNIMLSNMSLLELLWEGKEEELTDKTIEIIYLENINHKIDKTIEYDKLIFDEKEMLSMTEEKNWPKYRHLLLGKLIRYGLGKIKIKKKISGQDGFDAFVLEDIEKNILLYFPCTNLIELNDYLYDSYPIMDSLPIVTKIGNNKLNIAKKIYLSQQNQAKTILKECLKNITPNCKVNVSGFSLGGSLAEVSYLNSYDNKSLGDIILFNPYHNRVTSKEANKIKEHLKLYVCEGDSVSTIFNYNEFSMVAKPIYIDYQNNVSNTINEINANKGILNKLTNHIKNKYIDSYIYRIEEIKQKNKLIKFSLGLVLNNLLKKLTKLRNINLNTTKKIKTTINNLKKIKNKLEKHGIMIDQIYNIDILTNIHYIEFLFTSSHLPYIVDKFKEISFDKNGMVKKTIKLATVEYEIKYPSFPKTSINFFGNDIYGETKEILSNIKK